jgi:hypothetical protein
MADCVQAQIAANIKTALRTITTAGGYHYDVGAVEECRKYLQVNGRWDFILLLEEEPEINEALEVVQLKYDIWFFPAYNDEIIGNPALTEDEIDKEIAFHTRNVHADIAKALTVDTHRNKLADNTEIVPQENGMYIDGDLILFGAHCAVIVDTSIDQTNPYLLR